MKPITTGKLTWPRLFKRLPWLLLLPLGLLLPRVAAANPMAAEWYARLIYPAISGALCAVSGLFPFSLAEVGVYACLLLALGFVLAYVFRWLTKRIPLLKLVSLLLTLAIAAGALLNVFYLVWGFNYARPTLYELMDLPVRERPMEELRQLCEELATEAAALRAQVAEDAAGAYTLPEGWRVHFQKLPAAFERLGLEEPLFARRARPAKGVLASEAMSWAGIAGIYIPFTAEANVNVHQHPLLLLSSAAHETAHYLGVAKEDEANFVAYLACRASEDPAIAYSGAMLALIHCTNKLHEADPAALLTVQERYSEGMVRDLLSYNAYWDRYEGALEAAVTSVNDTYLKLNQQQSGVKSYGLMVDLLLAWRATQAA